MTQSWSLIMFSDVAERTNGRKRKFAAGEGTSLEYLQSTKYWPQDAQLRNTCVFKVRQAIARA